MTFYLKQGNNLISNMSIITFSIILIGLSLIVSLISLIKEEYMASVFFLFVAFLLGIGIYDQKKIDNANNVEDTYVIYECEEDSIIK